MKVVVLMIGLASCLTFASSTSVFRVVICERSTRTIRCPSGQGIEIISAFYGRKNKNTCPKKSIRTTHCEAKGSFATIQASCDDFNSCKISASNSVFGDPCKGTTKYVLVRYNCRAPSKGVKAVICERSRKTISCLPGQVINVKSAVYGRRDKRTCRRNPIKTTRCAADNSLYKVRASCNDRNKCKIYASNSVFGDPCVGTTKYVEMRYNCYTPYQGITTIICERESQAITCPPGWVIRVKSGFYGRKGSSICPRHPIRTTGCEARGSLSVIREHCNGYTSCYIRASNSVFGDPCKGTTKYVQMVYSCEHH